MSKYSDDENDSSDDEITILDERDPRCRVIYTHPDFQNIFQNSNTRNELIENDKAKSTEKFQSYEECKTKSISPTENDKRECIVNEVSGGDDTAVSKNKFSSAKNFIQRLFKFQVFKNRSRKCKM